MKFSILGMLRIKPEAKEAINQTGQIKNNLDQANKSAANMKKNLQGGGGGGGPSQRQTYTGTRSVIGGRQATGRNFSGMAAMVGGAAGAGGANPLVSAYAELAANIFALTAAFGALSEAARVEQLTSGLKILGATAGTNLTLTAKGLREVTDNAISTADAMRAVAQASSAGLATDEIERLGAVARGASVALGRGLTESMDRLTRGAIKLEPELLDELGIMVRLDEAVKQYALENNKAASSLSLTERRQAFLNAVLEEGERKFGDIAEQAGTNPYDKLAAAVRDMGTVFLNVVNERLVPFVNLFASFPSLVLLPLASIFKRVAGRILPNFETATEKVTASYNKQKTVIRGTLSVLQQERMLRASSAASLEKEYARGEQASVKKMAQYQREIAASNKIIKNLQRRAVAERNVQRVISTQVNAIAAYNDQLARTGPLRAFLSGLKTAWLGVYSGSLQALKGTRGFFSALTAGAKIGRFALMGLATSARLVGMALLNAIPIIGQIMFAFGLAQMAFDAFQSKLAKKRKEISKELNQLATDSDEVGRQIEKHLASRNYGKAFEAAITNINELIMKMKELRDATLSVLPEQLGEGFFSKQFAPQFIREARDAISNPLTIFTRGAEKKRFEGGLLLDVSGAEAKAINQVLARQATISEDLASNAYERIKAGEDYLTVLEETNSVIKSLGQSWSSVREASKKAGQAVKQFYGKTFTETTYSDVLAGLREAETQFIAVRNAGLKNEAIIGLFDSLRAGGEDLAIELDSLSNSTLFSAKFREATNINAQIAALEKVTDRTQEQNDELSRLQGEYQKLSTAVVEGFINQGVAAKAAGREIEQFIIQKNIEVAKTQQRILDIELKILNTRQKSASIRSSAERFRQFGTDERTKQEELADEIRLLKDRRTVEKSIRDQKIAVINLEFSLLAAQMDFEKTKLLRSKEALSEFKGDSLSDETTGPRTGSEIVNRVIRNNENLITSFAAFKQQAGLSIDVTDAQAESLYGLYRVQMSLAQQTSLNTRLRSAQIREINAQDDALDATIEKLEAELAAYNNIYNVRQRVLESLRDEITHRNNLKAKYTEQANALREIALIEADIALINADRQLSSTANLQRGIDAANAEKTALQDNLSLKEADMRILGLSITRDRERLNTLDSTSTEYQALNDTINTNLDILSRLGDEYLFLEDDATIAIDRIIAKVKQLEAQQDALSVPRILGREMDSAQGQLGLAKAGGALRAFGMGDTFDGLVSSIAQQRNVSIAEVLANPDDVAQIKQMTLSLEGVNAQVDMINSMTGALASGFSNAFSEIVTGSGDAGTAFKAMATSMLQALSQLMANQLAIMLFSSFFGGGLQTTGMAGTTNKLKLKGGSGFAGALTGGGTPVPGNAMGGIMGYANGGIIPRQRVPEIVKSPTFLVGEGRMNEAVVPLPNGRAIPVQMHGGGSQNNNVVVNVNVTDSGADTQTEGQDYGNLGSVLAVAIQKELHKQKRPGGILNRYGAA